jgi:hypothetical protein
MGQKHPLQWVVEPLMDEPSYLQRAMFGCLGCYLHGRLMLVLAARREPGQRAQSPRSSRPKKAGTVSEYKQALFRSGRRIPALASNKRERIRSISSASPGGVLQPWQGLLVPTSREHHAALLQEESTLAVHPVLSKWLYLTETSETFEESAQRLVAWILADDPRIGVEPSSGSRRSHRGAARSSRQSVSRTLRRSSRRST